MDYKAGHTDGMLRKDRDVGHYSGENSAESSNSVLPKWPVCAPSHVGRAVQERYRSSESVLVVFFSLKGCNDAIFPTINQKLAETPSPLFRLQTRSLLNMKAGSDKRAFHHRRLVGTRD